MSTKSTIAYGRNFHLYREALDEDYIYLELEGTKFEALVRPTSRATNKLLQG